MSTALLHFSPEGDRVIGAWVKNGPTPESAYRGTALESERGKRDVLGQPQDESWLDWCRQLAERTPVTAWYECREVPDGSSAQDALDAEVARQFS